MKYIVFFATSALSWLVLQNSAQAQIAFGPGFFEAPYVRLEWDHGGLHVQAPFVDLHTGGWCRTDAMARPAVPIWSRQPLASPPSLAQQLYTAGRELNRALEQFNTAATWQRYLGLSPGEPLASVPVEHLLGQYMYPSSDVVDVDKLRRHFEIVSRDERYHMIAALPAFQKTFRLLIEFLDQPKTPPERAVEELPAPDDTTIQDDRPTPQD
jgi:hypothetical protein